MKRIRIWLSSFNLIQQFIAITFLTIAFFGIFFYGFTNNVVDGYINKQISAYLNNSQKVYQEISALGVDYKDENVDHYLYNVTNKKYNKYNEILDNIDPIHQSEGVVNVDEGKYVYLISDYNNNTKLVSIASNKYREKYHSELVNAVINVILAVVTSLFILFVLWIVSLIRPLNEIKVYIEKIKKGEQADLRMFRGDEIGEVAEALTNMHDELEKQASIKEEMVQNISHDLKTPIATIKSYSESIKDGVYPYDTLEKSVDVIIEHASRLEKKVYSLITLNKMGYLGDNNDNQETSMNDVINKVILSLEVLRNDITIKTEIAEDIYFRGEEESWRVVVENLLDNALRYAKTYVAIKLDNGLLEVSNDGPKMDNERIEKLFKPYEKGTNGRFGLGLSIVKRVTSTYDYSVVGENTSDGVVFRITGSKIKKAKKSKDI